MKNNHTVISNETQQQAMQMAKSTQRPEQTKEQTKLIAQGIAKGIAEYKKQHKQKSRQADKAKKKNIKEKRLQVHNEAVQPDTSDTNNTKLPWILLTLSWIFFAAYLGYVNLSS